MPRGNISQTNEKELKMKKLNPIQLLTLLELVDEKLTAEEAKMDTNKQDWNTLHNCEQLCLIEQMLNDMYYTSLKEEDLV